MALVVAVAVTGVWAMRDDFGLGRNMEIMVNMMRELSTQYVDEVSADDLMQDGAMGMVRNLDPYTEYMSDEAMSDFEFQATGKYGGIGATIRLKRDSSGVVIAQPYKGSPSDKAGLKIGDKFVSIDGEDVTRATTEQVSSKLKGTPGTTVRLGVKRLMTGEVEELEIERARIAISGIPYAGYVADGIGYIRHNDFSDGCYDDMRAAVERLRAEGELRGLVLDYRDNGGGSVSEAVKILSMFLPKGTEVVNMKGRTERASLTYSTESNPVLADLPLVALINGASASASEIVAGALQDWDRATIIGRRSFGKGLVQRQLPLGDGSAMRLTISQYHTPTGRAIQRPYTNGERREYYLDNLRGYTDSITDATPHYRTLKRGRKIYGGGGVRPDVEVQADTTGYTEYYAQLMRKGVLTQTVTDWLDKERTTLLHNYPTLEQFLADYAPSKGFISALVASAEKAGINYNAEQFERSRHWITTLVKAHLAQRLYGIEGFYRVVNPALNESYVEALKHFEK